MVAPSGRETIELRVILRSISICVPLKVTKAYVHNHVDTLQLRQTFKQIKRQCA